MNVFGTFELRTEQSQCPRQKIEPKLVVGCALRSTCESRPLKHPTRCSKIVQSRFHLCRSGRQLQSWLPVPHPKSGENEIIVVRKKEHTQGAFESKHASTQFSNRKGTDCNGTKKLHRLLSPDHIIHFCTVCFLASSSIPSGP